MRTLFSGAVALMLAGCASGPDFRTDFDPTADFSSYKTYGWVNDLGTDKAGYSTLITSHFKDAVGSEMQALGYEFSADNPDLLVNFSANVEESVDVRSRPGPRVGVSYGGYYGYRFGVYNTFPLYEPEVETVRYKTGTANVDVIDAARKQLIWEGLAEGRLSKDSMVNPRASISRVIAEIFKRYPTANSGD